MSEENINIATKEYTDAHFGNTSETNDNLVIATKEYVDSIPTGMVMDGTALKGQLCNPQLAMTVGDGADGSMLTNGSYMFRYCESLTSFSTNLPNLTNGTYMFSNCSNLASWAAELPNLTNGSSMFNRCSNLTSWTVELPNLTNGSQMFFYCSGLTSWTVELPNLTNGSSMFNYCSNLTSWTVELPNLTNGTQMFSYCSGLTSWTAELPNLTTGSYMFQSCSSLTSFNAGTEGLKSLSDGTSMFYNCILNEVSVLHILNTIPTYTSGTHNLNLGKRTNYLNSTDIAALLNTTTPIAATNYSYKGWTITVQS